MTEVGWVVLALMPMLMPVIIYAVLDWRNDE